MIFFFGEKEILTFLDLSCHYPLFFNLWVLLKCLFIHIILYGKDNFIYLNWTPNKLFEFSWIFFLSLSLFLFIFWTFFFSIVTLFFFIKLYAYYFNLRKNNHVIISWYRGVEVRFKDHSSKLVQHIPLENPTYLVQGHAILIASASVLWQLHPVPFPRQVDQLLELNAFIDAKKIEVSYMIPWVWS